MAKGEIALCILSAIMLAHFKDTKELELCDLAVRGLEQIIDQNILLRRQK